jgi:hypothetical protein
MDLTATHAGVCVDSYMTSNTRMYDPSEALLGTSEYTGGFSCMTHHPTYDS